MLTKNYFIYILSNNFRNVIYVGFTSNLGKRVFEHKAGLVEGFSKKYHLKNLVYFESVQDVHSAITREKEIKGWKRFKKNILINKTNPSWRDLSLELN